MKFEFKQICEWPRSLTFGLLSVATVLASVSCSQATEALEEETSNLGNVNVPTSSRTIDQDERTVLNDIIDVVGASHSSKAATLATLIDAFDDRSVATVLEYLNRSEDKDHALTALIDALNDSENYDLVEILDAVASSDGSNLHIDQLLASARDEAMCGTVRHAATESRTRFDEALVPLGQSCNAELQERTCQNGSFTSWSGSYDFETCQISGCMDDRYHEYSATVEVSDPSACLTFNVCTTWIDSGKTTGVDVDGGGQDYAGGDGTPGDPYLVCDAAGLDKIRNHLDQSFQQAQNIDLDGYEASDEVGLNRGWKPIGTFSDPFEGSFNGTNFKITNMSINRPNTNFVGLFGNIASSSLINLTIEDANVVGAQAVGSAVGSASDSIIYNVTTQLDDCDSATCTVTSGSIMGRAIGGVGGQCLRCAVHTLTNNLAVFGDNFVGGVFGSLRLDADSHSLTNNGAVRYQNSNQLSVDMGGVAGLMILATSGIDVKNLRNNGNVTSVKAGDGVGGVLGRYDGDNSSNATLKNVMNTGAISNVVGTGNGSGNGTGGIIGKLDYAGTEPSLSHFLNKGSIAAHGHAGGLIGQTDMNITLSNMVNVNSSISSTSSRSTIIANIGATTITYNNVYGVSVTNESHIQVGRTDVSDFTAVITAGNGFTVGEGWSPSPVNLEIID